MATQTSPARPAAPRPVRRPQTAPRPARRPQTPVRPAVQARPAPHTL
jgi:hypothetical protein